MDRLKLRESGIGPRGWSHPERIDEGGEKNEKQHEAGERTCESKRMPLEGAACAAIVTGLVLLFAQDVKMAGLR